MMFKSEILFVDPSVSDIATILGGLRHEVEAIVLDSSRPAARQIAEALCDRRGLDAVHVIAHGAPGRVRFAAGEWSATKLGKDAEDFPAIGRALGADGDLRLWSCSAGAGPEGDDFVACLAWMSRADVSAPSGPVGAAARGGGWRLNSRSSRVGAPPPLSAAGMASYCGVLDDFIQINTHGAPVTLDTGPYSLVAKTNGKTEVIGQFHVLKGHPHDILVRVATGQFKHGADLFRFCRLLIFTVHAGPDGNLRDGQITVYDSSGNYSQRAALALLGADGGSVAVRQIAPDSLASLSVAPGSAGATGEQPQSFAKARKTP
jgi:Domain of unknown function (DUF4347)